MCVAELGARPGDARRRSPGARVPPLHGSSTREEIREPRQRRVGLREHVPVERQLLPVVHRKQQVAQRRRAVALVEDVAHGEDVAERLRHLLVVEVEELDVHPEARRRAAGGAFGLRDLVLVVRKDQIDAAAVDVDRRLAQQPQRHRRALDVPAGPAGSAAVVPRRLARLGGLPQHEVARVLLGVVVRVHARAGLDAFVIETRQLAVRRQRRDAEVDRPVGLVGVPARLERLDHLDHRAQVGLVGGARILFHRLETHRRRVLAKRRDEPIGVLAQRDAGLAAPR